MDLSEKINSLFDRHEEGRIEGDLQILEEFRAGLNRGEISVVEPRGTDWMINVWIKRGLLLHSLLGELRDVSGDGTSFDFDTMRPRVFKSEDCVRVPPGSSIRDGVYLAHGVTCMPPVFINMGAYVDEGTSIDSHTMIGVCTRIGKRVRIGCGTQIGGVLEPLDRPPAIIGSDAVIGGNCGIYDGPFIGDGAVLAPGTILTRQTRIYDPFRKKIYKADGDNPLPVPPMSIIHPGGVIVNKGPAKQSPLIVDLPIVIGYMDDPKLSDEVLEELLGQ